MVMDANLGGRRRRKKKEEIERKRRSGEERIQEMREEPRQISDLYVCRAEIIPSPHANKTAGNTIRGFSLSTQDQKHSSTSPQLLSLCISKGYRRKTPRRSHPYSKMQYETHQVVSIFYAADCLSHMGWWKSKIK